MQIVGINGYKQSGKDTAAMHLIEKYNFERRAFADKVKKVLAVIFDIPPELMNGSEEDKNQATALRWVDLTPEIRKDRDERRYPEVLSIREALQIFATEVCRSKIPDIWVRFVNLDAGNIVFSDVRFENEAKFIKEKGGIIIRVTRPGAAGSNHASEEEMDKSLIDYEVTNDATIDDLYSKIDKIMEQEKQKIITF